MARELKRTRKRRLAIDREKLIERAKRFHDRDEQDRGHELFKRRQRYAKFRQWTNGGTNDWANAADVAVPDLATISLRTQDTLYNATVALRPTINARAVSKADVDKQGTIDRALDAQVYVENGDAWLSDLIDAYTNDGHFTAHVTWVREERDTSELRLAEPIPEGQIPAVYFARLCAQWIAGPGGRVEAADEDQLAAWDFVVTRPDGEEIDAAFYTAPDGAVEMLITRRVSVFDGPKITIYDREDVWHPPYCTNLQIPGPSNPGGAAHVGLTQRPTKAEILKLYDDGYYDEMTAEDRDTLLGQAPAEPSDEQAQRATISGNAPQAQANDREDSEQDTVERWQVYDTIEIDGEFVDVVYWLLPDEDILLRVRRLGEIMPGSPPRRPFAEEQFLPVRGQRTGIGVLELGEGLHDARKMLLDLAIDGGSLSLSPFFFYRPTSTMKPDVIRLASGDGYPLANPKDDVNFPVIPQQGAAFAFNMISLLDRDQERLQMQSALSYGQVPAGKASALRTLGGMQSIMAQGEARPERILRRFFHGLAQIWSLMHRLNRYYLTGPKKFRVAFALAPEEEPYAEITPEMLNSDFDFEFCPNAFNASREGLQQGLAQLAQLYLSPLAFQSGVANARTVYSLFRDLGKAWGQDPDRYLSSPLGLVPITAEEALLAIMDSRMPNGIPSEGFGPHLEKLMAFIQSDNVGYLEAHPEQIKMLGQWLQIVQGMAQQAQAQQAAMEAAAASQNAQPGQATGRPPEKPPESPEQGPVGPGELADETLPGAGGGANQMAMKMGM